MMLESDKEDLMRHGNLLSMSGLIKVVYKFGGEAHINDVLKIYHDYFRKKSVDKYGVGSPFWVGDRYIMEKLYIFIKDCEKGDCFLTYEDNTFKMPTWIARL